MILLTGTLFLNLLLLAARPVYTFTPDDSCTLDEFYACLQSLQSVTQGNDLALATTLDELLALCSKLKESVECVDDHMKRCFSITQRRVFNDVVRGARQVIAELCVPGPIQEGYIRHALCYKNVSLDEEKCAPTYRHIQKMSENVDEAPNVEEGLRKSCCAFKEFVHCKYVHVSHDCGEEAGEFLAEHLERISGPLIHEHCDSYTYGSDTCSTGGASSCSSVWLPAMLFVSGNLARAPW